MPQRHGIKCDLVAKVVVISGDSCGRRKLDLVRNDFLTRKRWRSQPGFDIGLSRRLTIAVVGAVRDFKEHS